MFIVRNKEGNAYRELKTEFERDRYLSMGYIEVKEEPKAQKPSSKGAKKNKVEN
jgi:hypothetical protein